MVMFPPLDRTVYSGEGRRRSIDTQQNLFPGQQVGDTPPALHTCPTIEPCSGVRYISGYICPGWDGISVACGWNAGTIWR